PPVVHVAPSRELPEYETVTTLTQAADNSAVWTTLARITRLPMSTASIALTAPNEVIRDLKVRSTPPLTIQISAENNLAEVLLPEIPSDLNELTLEFSAPWTSLKLASE